MKLILDSTKELIIITEHFSPSTGATAQLIADLAEDLFRQGVNLRVLTSTIGSSGYPFPVHRFAASRSSSSATIFHKAIYGLHFFTGSAIWLLSNVQHHQSLLIVSNPPFIGLIGVILSIVRKTRYIFLFQDVFPRSASLTGILPAQGPIRFFWRSILKTVLTRSQATIVLSESMTRRCQLDFGFDTTFLSIANWAVLPAHGISKQNSCFSSSWGVNNCFTVQYSGNFGRLHEILTILEAARLLKTQNIKFVFVGGGAKEAQIRKYAETYNLDNITVKPYQSRELLADSLAACDVSVVSLIPGAEDTVAPSKFYGIIASSRPVLLISNHDSDLAKLVRSEKIGLVIEQGDVTLLADAILSLKYDNELVLKMGSNARKLYEKEYGRNKSTRDYYHLLRQFGMI